MHKYLKSTNSLTLEKTGCSGSFKRRFSCGEWHQLEGTGFLKDAQPYNDQQDDSMVSFYYILGFAINCF